MTRLFVYGTLRRGAGSHHLMSRSRYLDRARTDPAFTLVDLGAYPALVAGGFTAVVGEIYEVDGATLTELDIFEEVPEVYRRVALPVAGREACAYLLRPELAEGAPVIASGDWLAYQRRGRAR